ncbi:MAG: amidohydrolase family protein, partial [Anaerolineae bacterium]|nr:amidohydrolase family protein [Anaerolineae bacterium]
MLIKNAQIVTPAGLIPQGWMRVEGQKILQLAAGDSPENEAAIDAQGNYLLPGFIDVHVHGGVGYEAMDATPEAIQNMAQFYARHGVTAFLATTWTDTRKRIQAALENIAALAGTQPDGATLLGAHVEGPYLNPEKCGAQNLSYIRRADREEALAWLDLDVVRLLALAPEYEENHWLIEACARRGITVSAAHTSARYADMQKAVSLGLT